MKAVRYAALLLGSVVLAEGAGFAAQDKGPVAAPVAPPPPAESLSVQILTRLWPADLEGLQKYLPIVKKQTTERWMQVMPPEAKPPKSIPGMVNVDCWLHTDGRASNVALAQTSGNKALDRAALAAMAGAVSGASPYDSFPYGLSVDRVKVRLTFIYNHGAAPTPLSGPTVIR